MYRDLEVYKEAFKLAMEVFWITREFPKEEVYSLTSQIVRSSRSVSANISEGWAKRKYDSVFKQHLIHALGSNSETEDWLNYALECKYIPQEIFNNLLDKNSKVGRMLMKLHQNWRNYETSMLKSLTPKEMTNSELHVTELLNIYRHMKNRINNKCMRLKVRSWKLEVRNWIKYILQSPVSNAQPPMFSLQCPASSLRFPASNTRPPVSSLQFLVSGIMILLSFQLGAQNLQEYIDEALKNNPEIQKFELQHQIASEKVNEVNTLPNTEIGFGYFISEPETRTGAQRYKVSAKQMIPWFGTITARKNYISTLADATYENIAIVKRKLIASVSQSYYNLYAIKAKQEVLFQNIELLRTYETMALTFVEVGKASAVDVLRLQMRQNELDQLYKVFVQDFLAEQTIFNKLLNRDKDIEVTIVFELKIPKEDEMLSIENLQLHPELIKYDKLYRSVEQSELLNQKESAPNIGFGLDYIAVTERPDLNFSDNGKDILMPMLTLSIPIFNKKYKSKTKQNELKQQEITAQKQERLNKLEGILDKAIKNRIATRISYNTQVKNLKQAKDAEDILIRSYETGTIDFNDVLDIQELQLKFQTNQITSIKKYYLQTIAIHYLTSKK